MAVSTNPALRKSLVAAQQVSDEASRYAVPKLRDAPARKPLSSRTSASRLTRQSPGRSLRDEILAHVDGA